MTKRNSTQYLLQLMIPVLLLAACCSDCKVEDKESEKVIISSMLDSMNVAASQADFDRYFSFYAEDAVFMGTDATERWDKKSFIEWSKPYFDRGKAWSFTAVKRNIIFEKSGKLAWFDELLDTQMKICRGSGVVEKVGRQWKIKQYVLSMTIPNSRVDSIIPIKGAEEDSLLRLWKQKQVK